MSNNLNSHKHSTSRRPKHGLFFATMVPPSEAESISILFDRLRKHHPVQKPQIPNNRLHISLFALLAADSLPEQIIQLSRLAGDAIHFVEFDLTLDRVLTYRNKREEKPLVLAADAASTNKINGLVRHIEQTIFNQFRMARCRTKPINPHVTLTWDRLSVPEQPVPSITLPIREVALVHSHIGKSKYDILERWQLIPR